MTGILRASLWAHLILVDYVGPFDWKTVEIGPPMDVALGWVYGKDEDEAKDTRE
jgi:hypothetical protein